MLFRSSPFPEFKDLTWGGKGEKAIFGDCALKHIDKQEAIKELIDYLKIDQEDIIAFGDAEVDIPMFDKEYRHIAQTRKR